MLELFIFKLFKKTISHTVFTTCFDNYPCALVQPNGEWKSGTLSSFNEWDWLSRLKFLSEEE